MSKDVTNVLRAEPRETGVVLSSTHNQKYSRLEVTSCISNSLSSRKTFSSEETNLEYITRTLRIFKTNVVPKQSVLTSIFESFIPMLIM